MGECDSLENTREAQKLLKAQQPRETLASRVQKDELASLENTREAQKLLEAQQPRGTPPFRVQMEHRVSLESTREASELLEAQSRGTLASLALAKLPEASGITR